MCQDKNLANDPNILNDDVLWRRINPAWIKDGRVTTQAFQNYPGTNNMSAHLSRLTTSESALQGHVGYSLVGFTVQLARVECDQIVALDPTPEDQSHTAIIGDKPGSVQKRFRNNLHWVVQA
jgi:hypothetical protein